MRGERVILIVLAALVFGCGGYRELIEPTEFDDGAHQVKEYVQQVLANPSFRNAIRQLESSDLDQSADPAELLKIEGGEILKRLEERAGKYTIKKWTPSWRWTRAIAKDGGTSDATGASVVEWNVYKLGYRSYAAWTGTTMHELSHAAGFKHRGNYRRGNECTIPHVVGDLAQYFAVASQDNCEGEPYELPPDFCGKVAKRLHEANALERCPSQSAPTP